MSSNDHLDADSRIAQLEQRVADLTTMLERFATVPEHVPAAQVQVVDGSSDVATVADDSPAPAASRRNMLKLLGAATAGAVVATTGNVLPAAAVDGDSVNAGETTTTTAANRNSTVLSYGNSLPPRVPGIIFGTFVNSNIFLARDVSGGILSVDSSSSYPAASAGYSYRTVANGMYGYTANDGYGVVGYGGAAASRGILARGSRANLELYSAGDPAPSRSDAHTVGELICDENGDIWACVASGTPGTWRKLAGAGTGGAFHPISPSRVYDSRLAEPAGNVGLLTNGSSRTVSVADQRNLTTGAVVTANVVPAGATAVTANVTVTDTQGNGFLAINPGGDTEIKAAAVNWAGNGLILNNGLNLTLNATREVTIICGGGGNTHVVVDVTGYFL